MPSYLHGKAKRGQIVEARSWYNARCKCRKGQLFSIARRCSLAVKSLVIKITHSLCAASHLPFTTFPPPLLGAVIRAGSFGFLLVALCRVPSSAPCSKGFDRSSGDPYPKSCVQGQISLSRGMPVGRILGFCGTARDCLP
ncbi:uncharacterized protein UV8b_07576 [Ustilaginoidea virens]|uniref:Uncharacterized protein n=1 Tax=Ustilaginoidea virens TaxID=1159556 RepID=A0A8E5HXA7_USTVR|nr:uncharacterized protein UV8b_07576 [Ustilaginoidea virens]QUC23335.1 hypothetical protein UV8b_07576 [Ustilaginoidea virens]